LQFFYKGWLKISSDMFGHTGRFPPITLPSGKMVTIQTDKKKRFYRINGKFNKHKMAGGKFPSSKYYFWFRLSGKNLYYSGTKESINVLGSIAVKNIIDAHPHSKYTKSALCFKVFDREKKRWKLCAQTIDLRNKWICKIKIVLGLTDRSCKGSGLDDADPGKIIIKNIIQPTILIPQPSKYCNDNWNYKLNGKDWECDCIDGKEQSPIDLPPLEKAIGTAVKPLFQYNELEVNKPEEQLMGENLSDGSEDIFIKFATGALRINNQDIGRIVTLDGAIYNAEEVVFHNPSEHTINGKRFEMEMQIIHHGITKGDTAKHVVLSFLFEKKVGNYNKFIDDIDFFNLPNPMDKQKKINTNFFLNKIFYSSDETEYPFWKPFSFYTYRGSLSQPPCSEKAIVYVASKPIHLGSTALQLFQEAIRMPDMQASDGSIIVSPYPPYNNRKTQKLNGRAVFFYNHVKYCGPDPPAEKIKPKGHFEKVIKKLTNYFYVNGESPSGLPGAFVVSEKEALGKKKGSFK